MVLNGKNLTKSWKFWFSWRKLRGKFPECSTFTYVSLLGRKFPTSVWSFIVVFHTFWFCSVTYVRYTISLGLGLSTLNIFYCQKFGCRQWLWVISILSKTWKQIEKITWAFALVPSATLALCYQIRILQILLKIQWLA
jgi:hypothetical protein